jgi:pheromone shutdown protein TraB
MPSLMIIGTAHVIDLSLPLEGYIREFNPDSIALELDRDRWFALQSNSPSKGGPFFLRLLSRIQKHLGESFGSSPGSEMLVAGNVARSLGSEINLIDKPILPTIMDAWKNMPWIELRRIIKDLIFSFIGRGDADFSNSMITGDFAKELKQFSVSYPVIKAHLIDRRDTYMAKNLVKLFRKNNRSRIVAIVGEGHVDGMAKKLSSLNPKIVRLSALLSRKENTVSFSIKI